MMPNTLPPLTDCVALLGVNLVVCAAFLRLLCLKRGPVPCARWHRWAVAALFAVLWLPAGSAGIPLAAYIRGIGSDLSVTLVVLAAIGIHGRWTGRDLVDLREKRAVQAALAVTAVFLYPLALGWGDHDLYRAGWGSAGMLAVLLVLVLAGWFRGLRLLPWLVASGLLAWTVGLMESSNLFDYLMDPWVSVWSIAASAGAAIGWTRTRIARRAAPAGSGRADA